MRVAILASGNGSILESIIKSGIEVALVLVDRPCKAVKVGMSADIPVELVLREDFTSSFDRDSYSEIVVTILHKYKINVIAMAGFGTVLSQVVFDHFSGRILNTHPSLLPKYKGWHAVRDVLENNEEITGCSVHIATLGVDEGPILAQEIVKIDKNDSEYELHERIKEVEKVLYPATIKAFLSSLET